MGNNPETKNNRKDAIIKYCLWCVNGSRKEVNLCPSTTCPLFAYRNKIIDKSVELS
jgi:hypothetical protein